MPRSKTALKVMRRAEKRRLRNRAYRSRMRTFVKRAWSALQSAGGTDLEQVQREVRMACRILDKTVSKGVIKKNTAARYKSKLTKALNRLMEQRKESESG
ncbi:MAG: 30S ribosomal protein S20 [Armatimonadetes bacterium]|nr:30S ribosomal protein S20 [Armatimonadota bacterium]MDW8121079.1 30S ribosomal protein S20 [Armatimonadota bacterium]